MVLGVRPRPCGMKWRGWRARAAVCVDSRRCPGATAARPLPCILFAVLIKVGVS